MNILRLLPVLFLLLISCKKKTTIELTGDLPVKQPVYVDLYDFISGKLIFTDTLRAQQINLQVDSIPKGIYQLVFSWPRDVLKPGEMKRYARFPELSPPRYFLTTTCWLDPKEATQYQLLRDTRLTQTAIESSLLQDELEPDLKVSSLGKNNNLYNDYLTLIHKYKIENVRQKDSLNQLLYAANAEGDLQRAKEIHSTMQSNRLKDVKNQMITNEVSFLEKHVSSVVVPYIFYANVKSKTDFLTYKPIYDKFSPEVKQMMTARISGYQRD